MAANYEMNKLTKKGWTKQPNAIFRDKDLTSDAYKVISFLLSITGDYHISESGIASTVNISLDRVKKAVKLLKSTGYIEVSKVTYNNRLNGYVWKISDTNGTYRKCNFRELENPATENPTDGISSDREIQRPKTRLTENPSIYEYTESYEEINNERRIDEHTELDERLHHQPDAVVEDVSLPPYSGNSSWESSSEAKASPLQGKKSEQGEKVISQKEYMFQQYLKKYPKKPTGSEMEATKQAFLEAISTDEDFTEIMAGLDAWCGSVDWTKEGGRYITKPLYFLTTRKWEEIPRTINTDIKEDLLRFMRGNTEDCI